MDKKPSWICNKCGFKIRKGPGGKDKMLEHRKVCHPYACFALKKESK